VFEELLALAERSMANFSSSVRDSFGASIISEVYEPMLGELKCLLEMEETLMAGMAEIDRRLEEIKAIGMQKHE